jgi:hypothetical protein
MISLGWREVLRFHGCASIGDSVGPRVRQEIPSTTHGDLARRPDVVAIQKCNQIATRAPDASVPRLCYARVLLTNQDHGVTRKR